MPEANIRISDLPPATLPLTGSELLELSQDVGSEKKSRKVSVSDMVGGALGLDATFVTVTSNAALPNERILTPGTGITIVDSGPGAAITVAVDTATLLGAQFVTLAADPTLPNERILTAGANINIVDGGAGGPVTIAVDDPILLSDGSAVAPSYSFAGAPGMGVFRLGAFLAFSVGGIAQFAIDSTALQGVVAGAPLLQNFDSTSTIPNIITDSGDVDTGLGSAGPDTLSQIAGGVEVTRAIRTTETQFAVAQSGNSSVPELTSIADLDTGWRWTGGNQMTFIGGGSRAWNMTSGLLFSEFSEGPALVNTTAQLDVATVLPDQADSNTGIGSDGNDTMSFLAGGVEIAYVDETGGFGSFQVLSGVVGNPGLAIIGDPSTGVFSVGAGEWSVAVNATEGVRISEDTFLGNSQVLVFPGLIQAGSPIPMLGIGERSVGFSLIGTLPATLAVVTGDSGSGTERFQWVGNRYESIAANGAAVLNENTSISNPTLIPNKADLTTGVGSDGAGSVSFIVSAVEGVRYEVNSADVMQDNQAAVGLTASVTQTQGNGQLTSSYNEVDTVANPNDTVTAPPVRVGRRLYVLNNGANDLQLFPSSGDDIGAGVDASIVIEPGAIGIFLGLDSVNWSVLYNAEPTPSGSGGLPEFEFTSGDFDNPNNADWTVNALAPAVADSNNNGLTVRLFDDTTEEGVGFQIPIPSGATNIILEFVSRAETAPGAAATVGLNLYNRGIPDNAAVEAWSAATQLTDIDIPTNENFQVDSQTITLASLGITAGELTQFELTRTDPSGGTELTGDWTLLNVKVSFN